MTDRPIPDDDSVYLDRFRYEHDNGVTVKLRYQSEMWEVAGCRWPASWGDDVFEGDEYGHGEVMRSEELDRRKSEAISEARELDHVRDRSEA